MSVARRHPELGPHEIFVFGSNLAGRHGAGAALTARRLYGAIYGQGVGRQGRSYAIPTKGWEMEILTLDRIQMGVEDFLRYADMWIHRDLTFRVTAIGTGHARYKHEQIAPLFRDAPANCRLPSEWNKLLGVGQALRAVHHPNPGQHTN